MSDRRSAILARRAATARRAEAARVARLALARKGAHR